MMSQEELSSRNRLLGRLALLVPGLWGLAYLFPPLNHDAAAILSYALRMIEGGRLYVDITDVNPPLIFWLSCLPAALARLLGAPPTMIYSASILAAIFGAFALARPAFRRLTADAGDASRALIAPAALFALIVLPADSFAQREHLMAALALPYLLLAGCRAGATSTPRVERIAAALLAAVGFAIKPHFLVIPVLVEVYVLAAVGARRALLDAAPWAMLAFFIIYLVAARLFTPEYFSFILPMATTYYEGGGLDSLRVALLSPPGLGTLLGLIGVLSLKRAIGWGRGVDILACFVAGAALAGIAQGRGWDYHFIAAKIGLTLLVVAALAAAIDRWVGARVLAPAAAGLLVALFIVSGAISPPWKAQLAFADSPAGRMYRLIEARAHGRPVMWFTTSIYPQFPVLPMTESRLSLRFMSLWLLPALYADAPTLGDKIIYHAPEAMPLAEAFLFRSVGADLAADQPALVIVTRSADEGGFGGRQFDYLDYFGREPIFAHAFQNYRYLTQIDGWAIYERKR